MVITEKRSRYLNYNVKRNRTKYLKPISDRNLETQLREMAEDLEVQAEIKAINQEFLVTEMDGLT